MKLIKRGPKYSLLTRHFSGVSGAIDDALATLEQAVALPSDYARPNADWGGLGTLTDIENRGVPEYMALLLARNDTPKLSPRQLMRAWVAKTKIARLRGRATAAASRQRQTGSITN